jgi:cytochrome b involved in lipid metabolism
MVSASPDISQIQPLMEHPIQRGKQAVTVWINLSVNPRHTSEYSEYYYQWAKERKDVVQVNWQKVEFWTNPLYHPPYLLDVVEPSSIQALEVYKHCDLDTLVVIAPDLGQVRTLQYLLLHDIHMSLKWLGNKEMGDWER